jgi:hypothetical protein
MKPLLVLSIALFAILFIVGFMNRSLMAGVVEAGLEHAGLKPMPEPEEASS